jgi:hypothetical protein
VSYAVSGTGDAPASEADFVNGALPSGVLTFAAGETVKTIVIGLADDSQNEGAETFNVYLSNAAGATVAVGVAPGFILDNDPLRSLDTPLASGDVLATAYQNVLRTAATSADETWLASVPVTSTAAGQTAMAQAIAQIVAKADATTSVATLAYQFFTGAIPSQAGIDYLVSPGGGNANNLNSDYYQAFSLENRYINFAVNLGKLGAGRASFEAKYGQLDLLEAAKTAYATIFGSVASDAKAHALIDSRVDYFAVYGGDGPNGIGTKAAMVGWLLAEAAKGDIGTYAKSNDAFLTDLADGASFAVDIVGVYGRPEYAYIG